MSNKFEKILDNGVNYTQKYVGQTTLTPDTCTSVDNKTGGGSTPPFPQASAKSTASVQKPLQLGATPSIPHIPMGSMQVPPPISAFPPLISGQGSILPRRVTSRQMGYAIRSAAEQVRREAEVFNAVEKLRYQNTFPIQSPQVSENKDNYAQLQLFSKVIVDAAAYLHKLTGISQSGIMFSILSIISMASWGRYKVKVRSRWIEPQVDYAILACPSGSRKSALCAALRKPFERFSQTPHTKEDAELIFELQDVIRSYNARLKKKRLADLPLQNPNAEIISNLHALAQESSSWKKVSARMDSQRRISLSAATQLGMIKAMASNGGCQAILEEEGHALSSDALLGKDNPIAFLKGHTMENIQYDSVKQGTIIVTDAALPQLHIVQKDAVVRVYSKQSLRKLGVLARFQIFIMQDTNRSYPTVDDEQGEMALETLQEHIFNILAKHHTNVSPRRIEEVQVSAEARAVAEEFEAQAGAWAEQVLNDDLRAYLNKLHGQAVRFAADLHLFNNPETPCETPITQEEMLAGVSMAQELKSHADVLYSPNGLMAQEHAKLILDWVKEWGEKAGRFRLNLDESWYCFTGSDVQQGIRELKSDVRRIWTALDVLEASGYIAQIQTGKNTRLCVLNPRIW